jgi:penicillin-binding protein-related factor A (putative recombinase)
MRVSSPRKLLEKDIEKLILQFLEYLPECYAWKNHTSGYFDTRTQTFKKQRNKYAINGVSDILGVYKSKFLAIEVKTPENKERPPEQVHFIETVKIHGGIAFFATSLDEVKKELGL